MTDVLIDDIFKDIVATIREPLLVLDSDLTVILANHSFYGIFKVKAEETVGQLIYNLGNKQWDIPKLRELLETILPEKTSFDNYEVEHDFATIGRRTMLLNARQIEQGMGTKRIILLAIEDITERKEIEAGDSLPEKQLENLKTVLRNSHHLLGLINSLLDISKIEAGRMEVFPEEFRLNLLISEVTQMIQPLITDKGLELITDIPDKQINLSADKIKLKQILINLVTQFTVAFTPQPKKISLE